MGEMSFSFSENVSLRIGQALRFGGQAGQLLFVSIRQFIGEALRFVGQLVLESVRSACPSKDSAIHFQCVF